MHYSLYSEDNFRSGCRTNSSFQNYPHPDDHTTCIRTIVKFAAQLDLRTNCSAPKQEIRRLALQATASGRIQILIPGVFDSGNHVIQLQIGVDLFFQPQLPG